MGSWGPPCLGFNGDVLFARSKEIIHYFTQPQENWNHFAKLSFLHKIGNCTLMSFTHLHHIHDTNIVHNTLLGVKTKKRREIHHPNQNLKRRSAPSWTPPTWQSSLTNSQWWLTRFTNKLGRGTAEWNKPKRMQWESILSTCLVEIWSP